MPEIPPCQARAGHAGFDDCKHMTEFTVAVYRNPTEHKIRLGQVTKWVQHTTKEGPAGIMKRERVRRLLDGP